MQFDLMIQNGTILTVNSRFDILQNGLIGVRNGKIEKITSLGKNEAPPPAKKVVDAGGGIIMPGLVNTHTHLPMTLFRGLADDLPLSEWLNDHIFPAEAAHITPESVRWGTRLACAEMLLSGTTTCCDGYFVEGEVAKAVVASGMRAVAGQGVIDFPAPGVPDPAENISTATDFVRQQMGQSDRITPSVFCHSPYTCSPETLRKAKRAADKLGVLFQIHLAETQTEYQQIQSEHGVSPVKYLDGLGLLDRNTLLVHAVWADAEDIKIISERGAKISHNPESNMKLASGVAPVPKFLAAGITVGLGTDGCASNNNLDLFQEMDTAAKLHKVHLADPTVMDAETVVRMATIEGAKAIGLDHLIGSIEIGKEADIIILDTAKPHLTPMYAPASHLVYAASGADVRHVIVGGRVVVKARELMTMDLKEVMAEVIAIAETIQNKNPGI
ncbi:amidohydrolase [Desulfonema ishimotonii]|uniref:5-methylthioadenosine/S-adenosylhomocysteine deaminase n=1 Tax=Desulfonema ishimotonii TaxID=45657 RepID=A0A401G205_9BACT|nr:amidohydrolase [Desulfonema ishimotonii]GBC63262.1 amidohydrolase [Desulfonema ishimotonii]